MYQVLRNSYDVNSFFLSLSIIKDLICSRQIVKIKINVKLIYNYVKLYLISRQIGVHLFKST